MMLKKNHSLNILFLIIITLAVRLFFSTFPSFEYDENAFRIWSQRLVEQGPARFHTSEMFTNNPLGGLYLFWFVGVVKNVFLPSLSFLSKEYDILLKLPANISDILTGVLIYHLIREKRNEKWAILGYLAYVFNPALIFNSAIWGQYDGIATLFLITAVYMAFKKKLTFSAILAAVAYALKPQAIFLAPALGIFQILNFKLSKLFINAFTFLATLTLLYLPFYPTNPISGLIYANKASATLFNCTTCFAFNFWGIFGNWQNDMNLFFNIPLLYWGIGLLLGALVIIFGLKRLNGNILYFTISVSMLAFFMLLTRIHERYIAYFLPFLLLTAMLLRSKIITSFYIFFSLIFLLNLYIPYAYYNNRVKITNLPVNELFNNFSNFALISFLGFILLFIYYINYVKHNSAS